MPYYLSPVVMFDKKFHGHIFQNSKPNILWTIMEIGPVCSFKRCRDRLFAVLWRVVGWVGEWLVVRSHFAKETESGWQGNVQYCSLLHSQGLPRGENGPFVINFLLIFFREFSQRKCRLFLSPTQIWSILPPDCLKLTELILMVQLIQSWNNTSLLKTIELRIRKINSLNFSSDIFSFYASRINKALCLPFLHPRYTPYGS